MTTSEHALWVNQKTLDLAHISRSPLSGPVHRGEYSARLSRPSHRRRHGSSDGAGGAGAARSFAGSKFEWLSQAMRYLNSFGITSATMATGNLADIELVWPHARSRAADRENAHCLRRRRCEPSPDATIPGRSGQSPPPLPRFLGLGQSSQILFRRAYRPAASTSPKSSEIICGVGPARLSD